MKAILLALALLPATLTAQTQLPPFLELRVPKPPTIAVAEGKAFLAYEMHVTNFAGATTTLKRVEVLSGGKVIFTLADSALTRALSRPGMQLPAADRGKLPGGARAVVWFWVPVDRGSAPSAVVNRVTMESGTGDSVTSQQLAGAPVAVAKPAPDIGPPLRGGTWLAGNGPDALSGHRRALIPIEGAPSIAQRFAIDWVKVDSSWKTWKGDSLKNSDYYAYGQDAIAVGPGTVVETKDGIPENVPGINSRAVPITLETVGGNHVVIDLGGGRYAFYAHLQPGSLRVKLGDKVHKGQVVGLVGNSGNSTEPHLHFHTSDGVSPLGSEGVPYGYDAFELVGKCAGFGASCQWSAPATRKGETPLANMLVRFR